MAQQSIDVHSHFFPKEYLEYLTTRRDPPTAKQTGPLSYVIYNGDIPFGHIDRPGHYDLKARIDDLDAAGLDVQLLSQTVPGPEILEPEVGVYWAQKINDALAQACIDYPGRFYAMASLPFQDTDASCKELERCREMGFVGIMGFSNIKGDPLFLDKYQPIFALASEWELPFNLHPTIPWTADLMEMLKIPYQLYGFTVDSSLSIISCIFQGMFEKHPKLTMVHGHLGGIIPYMPRRLQDAWKGYSKEWGLELEETPDVVYQKRVYPDTTSFYLPAMKACMEWVGPERLLIGTDYAHRVGDPEGAIQAINDLGEDAGLTQDQVDMIMGKNAEALYGLPAVL